MKKSLFFLWLLVLAGVVDLPVFAEISIGGSVVGHWDVLKGSTVSETDVKTGFAPNNGGSVNAVRGRLDVTATDESGVIGGWIQTRAQTDGDLGVLANTWWKPLDVLKVTAGYLWGGANAIGVALANDDIIPVRFYGRSGNYIPWGYEVLSGAHLEVNAGDLYLVASVPLDNSGNLSYNGWNSPYVARDATAKEIFQHTMARLAYTIPAIGTVRVTFAGGTGKVSGTINDSAPTLDTVDAAVIDAGFTLTLINDITLDLGGEVPLPGKGWDEYTIAAPPVLSQDVEAQVPYALNLRANVTLETFSLAGGVSGKFGGKLTQTTGNTKREYEQGFILGVTLNPEINLTVASIGILGELEFNREDTEKNNGTTTSYDSKVNFNVVPYIQKTVGGASLYAGFQIASHLVANGTGWKTEYDWSIPAGIAYRF
ncbi:MAG: hypothetical protein LBD93_04415 [Treponema sp.]|jgi:hypothetical protein|nr:hypothetical protein [Treponema sp.]